MMQLLHLQDLGMAEIINPWLIHQLNLAHYKYEMLNCDIYEKEASAQFYSKWYIVYFKKDKMVRI